METFFLLYVHISLFLSGCIYYVYTAYYVVVCSRTRSLFMAPCLPTLSSFLYPPLAERHIPSCFLNRERKKTRNRRSPCDDCDDDDDDDGRVNLFLLRGKEKYPEHSFDRRDPWRSKALLSGSNRLLHMRIKVYHLSPSFLLFLVWLPLCVCVRPCT